MIEPTIDETEIATLVAPRWSVVELEGSHFCHVWKDGPMIPRPVVIGRRTVQWVEILSGLTSGELVARDPMAL